jgi:hypothetical protein
MSVALLLACNGNALALQEVSNQPLNGIGHLGVNFWGRKFARRQFCFCKWFLQHYFLGLENSFSGACLSISFVLAKQCPPMFCLIVLTPKTNLLTALSSESKNRAQNLEFEINCCWIFFTGPVTPNWNEWVCLRLCADIPFSLDSIL